MFDIFALLSIFD